MDPLIGKASTEPPTVIGGEARRAPADGPARGRFNGAADGDRRRASAARTFAPRTSRFNGAADGDRRRGRDTIDRRVRLVLASTEPPTVIGGERRSRRAWRSTMSRCFNGAADGDRRRGKGPTEGPTRGAMLQRSRRR